MRNQDRYTLSPRARRRFPLLFLPLVGAVMMFVVVFLMREDRSVATPAVLSYAAPAASDRADRFVAESDTEGTDTLLADVYPSKRSAVQALTLRLPDAVSQVSDKPASFRLGFEESAPGGAKIYDELRKHFSRVRLVGPTDQSPKLADEVAIALRIDEDAAKSSHGAAKGNVLLTVSGADRATSLSTKFKQCNWADDLTDYINERPGHTWIVVRSHRPCVSPMEARRSAEDAAVDAISQAIQPRDRGPAPLLSLEQLGTRVQRDIRSQLPVSDHFVQQFRRPYGNVWSESILLDVSPQWVENFNQSQANDFRGRRSRELTTAASMAIVLAAILLAYFFVNAVTRRYFTNRLRAAAIMCALVVLALAACIISFG
jgi:hypothetical protein